MEKFALAKANPDTIFELYQIIVNCGRSMYEKYGLEHWYPFIDIEIFKKMIEKNDIYGVYQNGVAVATFNLSLEPRDYYYSCLWSNPAQPATYLGHLAVDPTVQGNGLGKWCIYQIEEIAKKNGSKAIRFDGLSIHPWLTLFYQKLGYLPRGILKPRQWDLLCFEKILE